MTRNHLSGVEEGTDHRALGIHTDNAHIRVLFLEIAPRARDGTPGTGADEKMGDAPAGLLPELRPRRPVMRVRVGLVVELVSQHRPRGLVGDGLGLHQVVIRMFGRYRGRSDDDISAERAEKSHLLLTHLVRHREHAVIALTGRCHCERQPGVAARGFNDGAARLQIAPQLRVLDHGLPDAILHGAARVHELAFTVNRGATAVYHPVQTHEGGPGLPSRAPTRRLQVSSPTPLPAVESIKTKEPSPSVASSRSGPAPRPTHRSSCRSCEPVGSAARARRRRQPNRTLRARLTR